MAAIRALVAFGYSDGLRTYLLLGCGWLIGWISATRAQGHTVHPGVHHPSDNLGSDRSGK
jgi:hypothetical protein